VTHFYWAFPRTYRRIVTPILWAWLFLSLTPHGFGHTGANLLKNANFTSLQGISPSEWGIDPAIISHGSATVVSDAGINWLVLSPNSANSTSDQDEPIFGIAQGIYADNLLGTNLFVSASMYADARSTAVMRVYIGSRNGSATYQEIRFRWSILVLRFAPGCGTSAERSPDRVCGRVLWR